MFKVYRQFTYHTIKNSMLKQQFKHRCEQFTIKANYIDLRINGENVITSQYYANNSNQLLNINCDQSKYWCIISDTSVQKRFKKQNKQAKEKQHRLSKIRTVEDTGSGSDEDDDDDHNYVEKEDDPDFIDGKAIGFVDITARLSSMRLDNVAKAGFKLSRLKADHAFYEGLFRVNGEKVLKKSMELNEGDECDMITGINKENANMLDITRVVVKLITDEIYGKAIFKVKLRKFLKLTVHDYPNSPYTVTQI